MCSFSHVFTICVQKLLTHIFFLTRKLCKYFYNFLSPSTFNYENFNRRVERISVTSEYPSPTFITNILLNFITYSCLPLSICQSILMFLDPFQSKLQVSVYLLPQLPNTSAYISLTRVQCWFTGFFKR